MMTAADRAVRRGAHYLDRWYPDWDRRIDLDTLDVWNQYHCPLAQATGTSFNATIEAVDHWTWWGIRRGFYPSRYRVSLSPVKINDAWRREVLRRRQCRIRRDDYMVTFG